MQTQSAPKIYLDGKRLRMDVDPVVYSRGLMVPVSDIARSLGADVSWIPETQTVIVSNDRSFVIISVGKGTAYKNHKPIKLDIPPRIVNDRTLAPLNFLGEALEVRTEWFKQHNAAVITSKMRLPVFYPRINGGDGGLVRECHEVKYTREVARAALQELTGGQVATTGASRVPPPDTKIFGISIKNGLATVDFSREVLKAGVGSRLEVLGIKSIVNSLTEYPSIQKVSFLVEGRLDEQAMDWWGHVGLYEQPFSRDLSEVGEPSAWVTFPAGGQVVRSPLTVRGLARAGSEVNARLADAKGQVIAEGFTYADSELEWAEFYLDLSFKRHETKGLRLEVFLHGAGQEEKDMEIISLVCL